MYRRGRIDKRREIKDRNERHRGILFRFGRYENENDSGGEDKDEYDRCKDAGRVAEWVFLPTSYVPPKDVRALRHLVRHRIFLGRYRSIIKNQIKIELRRSETKKCRNRDRESVFLRGLGSKSASVRKYELLWANNKRML